MLLSSETCSADHSTAVSLCRTQANDLAVLISRMQKNADQVEKNILQSEDLMDEVNPHELTTVTLAQCHPTQLLQDIPITYKSLCKVSDKSIHPVINPSIHPFILSSIHPAFPLDIG